MKENVPLILVLASTALLVSVVLLLGLHAIPESNREGFSLIAGGVITGWTTIIGYHFGSSAGSAKKTEIIAEVAKKEADRPKVD